MKPIYQTTLKRVFYTLCLMLLNFSSLKAGHTEFGDQITGTDSTDSCELRTINTDHATYYSGACSLRKRLANEHRNVKTLVQEIALSRTPHSSLVLKRSARGYKRFEYKYDLFSGNVHEATYQKGAADQWIHRYYYDANNRLRITETSHDGRIWDRDVKQYYYLHGALARLEIGSEQVQGLDYAGTILGWQKLLNRTWD
jgi:hypothetical protein